MAERRPSLRRRLMALLVMTTGGVWIAVAAATFFDARHHARELFDAQLEEYAEVLSAIAEHEVYEMEGEITEHSHQYAQALSYQVFGPDGRLLMRSHAAPERPLSTVEGFSDVAANGARVRVLRRNAERHGIVIVVASRLADREKHVFEVAMGVLLPLLIGLPLLGFAIWIAVARAIEPLARVAGEVRSRAPERLEPFPAHDAPREVMPLVEALNSLFARLERAFENERRFTGDAAHELRTPLAALRTQAEVALTTEDDGRRRHALERVVAGVERATRLVESLLALSRLDAGLLEAFEPVDLAQLAPEVAASLAEEAQARHIDLRIECAGPALVLADRASVAVLLRNLLENAVRFSPAGGTTRVRIERGPEEVELQVEDSGTGVPSELRERIFDRFFRIERSRSEGSGLGLSIARRIVEIHGGSIAAGASADLGGLAIRVKLPAAAARPGGGAAPAHKEALSIDA